MESNPIPIEEAVYIYALRDSETGRLRYIGQTRNPSVRLTGHLTPDSLRYDSAKNRWLRGLAERDLKPQVCILEVGRRSEADALEEKWIGYFLARGEPLLNVRSCDARNAARKASRNSPAPRPINDQGVSSDELVTVKQAAELKAATEDTVRRRIQRGALSAIKKADVWLIRRKDLDAWTVQRKRPKE